MSEKHENPGWGSRVVNTASLAAGVVAGRLGQSRLESWTAERWLDAKKLAENTFLLTQKAGIEGLPDDAMNLMNRREKMRQSVALPGGDVYWLIGGGLALVRALDIGLNGSAFGNGPAVAGLEFMTGVCMINAPAIAEKAISNSGDINMIHWMMLGWAAVTTAQSVARIYDKVRGRGKDAEEKEKLVCGGVRVGGKQILPEVPLDKDFNSARLRIMQWGAAAREYIDKVAGKIINE